ncbi:unnamed protein product, partial [Ixodes hexagonus]
AEGPPRNANETTFAARAMEHHNARQRGPNCCGQAVFRAALLGDMRGGDSTHVSLAKGASDRVGMLRRFTRTSWPTRGSALVTLYEHGAPARRPPPILVKWPQRVPSGRTVDILSDQPVGKPFFEAHATAVLLGPSRAPGDQHGDTPVLPVLRYALDPTTGSDTQPNGLFAIDAHSGQLSLTRNLQTSQGNKQSPAVWNLELEARVQGTNISSRFPIRVRQLKASSRSTLCGNPRRVCFPPGFRSVAYEFSEIVPSGTVVDALRPLAMAAMCPTVKPRYTLVQDRANLLSIGSANGVLSLSHGLHWNDPAVSARVRCFPGDGPTMEIDISVHVRDVDNHPPRLPAKASLECVIVLDRLDADTKLDCPLSILDGDSLEANKFRVSLEGDVLELFRAKTPHDEYFVGKRKETFLGVALYPRKSGLSFPGQEYTFNVVVEDVGLVRTDVSNKVIFTVVLTNSSAQRVPLQLQDTYNASMSRSAAALARMLFLWMNAQLSKSQCLSSCGPGAAEGRCQWREGPDGRYLSSDYSTCTGNQATCPDGTCDELETLRPELCPQDCTQHVVGEALLRQPGRGIKAAQGICSCAAADSCTCTKVVSRPESRDMAGEDEDPKVRWTPRSASPEAAEAAEASSSAVSPPSCGVVCLASLCLCGLALVGATLAGILFARRRRAAAKHKYLGSRASLSVPSDYVDGRRHPPHHQQESADAGTQASVPLAAVSPLTKLVVDSQWEFPRENLVLEQSLGEGEFGKVVRARARDIAGVRGFSTVAVKMLKSNSTPAEEQDLLSEFCMLKEVDHPNVIRLLGGCTSKGGPLYVIVEYAELGSLLSVLRRSRQLAADRATVVCNPTYMSHGDSAAEGASAEGASDGLLGHGDLLCYAWQIAKGMAYLADIKMVHRDLAARNILLAAGNVIKISDFGLSRDVYEGDTYLKKSRGRVPVKWMALESLEDHIYTSKSDVWSFGVVLWEIVTLGATPYPGVGPEYLFQLLKSGYRMHRPEGCSVHIYRMMQCCWQSRPQERPSFKELTQKLESILQDSASYLDLNLAQQRSYYNLNLPTGSMKKLLDSDDDVGTPESEYGRIEFKSQLSLDRRDSSAEENVGLLMKCHGSSSDSPVACWIARPE